MSGEVYMPLNLCVINGPNLNMLGKREKSIYGSMGLDEINNKLSEKFQKKANLVFFQNNHEGNIVDYIHELGTKNIQGIIINAGAYTHTSIAVRDALLSVSIPFIEVHISNVYKREDFRKNSYLSDCATGVISGLGIHSYDYAIDYFLNTNLT
jgi:3-dehydroquinate dehydratase-2